MVTSSNIDNINTIAGAASGTKSDKAQKALASTLDDFLKLLTTQLKNQDPTNAMDPNAFTQQIAQLSSVEQQINTNKNLESLLSLYSSSQINGVVGYIGKRVEAAGDKSTLTNGQAQFVYDLTKDAETIDVSISDSTGTVVFAGEGTKTKGRNEVFWDGKNSITGEQMPDGLYTIVVKAKDYAGKEIPATTYTTGRITAVDLQNGKPTLMMGTFGIPLEKVLKIQEDVTLV